MGGVQLRKLVTRVFRLDKNGPHDLMGDAAAVLRQLPHLGRASPSPTTPP